MPNEFVARNGVIALNNSVITGSLNVTSGITGSLFGTASFAQNVTSASFATTASYVLNAVSASFASTASFIPTSSLTGNFFVQGGNSFGAQAVLGTNDVQNLALETNGSTRMFISSGGNVGIGTTSSLANFQVGNSSALANYQGGLVGMMLPTGSGTWIELADNSTNGTAFRISKDSGAGIIFNANGREIGFKADSYSTTMTDAQLILKTSGNVGIGKTTPNAKLDVSGSVIISGNVGIANTSPLNKLHITQGTDTAYPTLGTGKGGLFIAGDNNLYGLYVGINTSDGNSYMQVMRNNTATAYNLILQPVGGNVGIGKTSPNATLDVSGSATITGSLNVLGSITTTGTITAQTLVVQTITSSVSFITGSTQFGSLLANTHQFTGSVSMTGSLAVTGTGTISTSLTNPLLIGGTTTTSTITYQPTSGVGTTGADHIFKVGNNGATEAMRILNNGNVGIGISPTGVNGKLQVTGSIGLSGNSEIRQNTNSDGSTLKILATQVVGASTNSAGYGYSGGGIIASVSAADSTLLLDAGYTTSTFGRFKVANTTSSNTSLSLEKNSVTTLFASTTGNVGIGTASPSKKLEVSGSDALINGITVGIGAGSIASNTAIGSQALLSNTTGSANTAIGVSSIQNTTTGHSNTAVGYFALLNNTVGVENTAIGRQALHQNTTGSLNTAVGAYALTNNTSNYNTALGYYVLLANTTGQQNTATGYLALRLNTTGSYNTANGVEALYANTTGQYNTATGLQALYFNTTGDSNTATGVQALRQTTTGSYNTANGYGALYSNTTGRYNTAIGYQAGYGTGTNSNTTGDNNIFIGKESVGLSPSGSNRTWIGNSSTTATFLAGNVLIGTTTDASYKLDVSGSARVQGGLVAPLLFNRITGSYTLVLADQGKMIEANFSTNLIITVPLALNVNFPIGTEISVVMRNTGTVQIVGEVGFSAVTVNSAGGLNTISTRYGAASLVKVGADEWYLYGNLT